MKINPSLSLALAAITLVASPLARAADADNTGNNVNDRKAEAVTPENQSNAKEDVEVTRAIRKAVVAEKDLSVYAHNIKIITTKEHVVYLRGAVASSDDVAKIVALAEKHAGSYPVKNQLSVSSK